MLKPLIPCPNFNLHLNPNHSLKHIFHTPKPLFLRVFILIFVINIFTFLLLETEAGLIHPKNPGDPLIYGIEEGVIVTIHPFGIKDPTKPGGPRGLIYIGFEENGKRQLLNYIAIEPIAHGRRDYSELEMGSDHKKGKIFKITNNIDEIPESPATFAPGKIVGLEGKRILSFAIHPERFENGSMPIIEVSLFEDQPERIRFRTFAASQSSSMTQCILTATMGNYMRCRYLWLAKESVFAPSVYHGYKDKGFIEKEPYHLSQLFKTKDGGVITVISPDEFQPREIRPFPGWDWWYYPGKRLAQFWYKPKGTYDDSLHCRVNGRHTYWAFHNPIPGGTAFENFELVENFSQGQESWFGFTDKSPQKQFGFPYNLPPYKEIKRTLKPQEEKQIKEAEKSGRTLTNVDFQNGLDGWIKSGMADKFIPSFNEKKVTTYQTGRLYQSFLVPLNADSLRFFVSGARNPKEIYVRLWDRGHLWRSMTGADPATPAEIRWDLKPLRGKAVTLEICDFSGDPEGYLCVKELQILKETSTVLP